MSKFFMAVYVEADATDPDVPWEFHYLNGFQTSNNDVKYKHWDFLKKHIEIVVPGVKDLTLDSLRFMHTFILDPIEGTGSSVVGIEISDEQMSYIRLSQGIDNTEIKTIKKTSRQFMERLFKEASSSLIIYRT